jgi:hypothetical protein
MVKILSTKSMLRTNLKRFFGDTLNYIFDYTLVLNHFLTRLVRDLGVPVFNILNYTNTDFTPLSYSLPSGFELTNVQYVVIFTNV